MALKCAYCEYVWKPRARSPKACPRCKRFWKGDKQPVEVDDVAETKWLYDAPDGGIVEPVGGNVYKSCVTCINLNRDSEAVYKWMSSNYCLEHFIAAVLAYDTKHVYVRPDVMGEHEGKRVLVRTAILAALSELTEEG